MRSGQTTDTRKYLVERVLDFFFQYYFYLRWLKCRRFVDVLLCLGTL